MNPKHLKLCVTLALLVAAVACDNRHPTSPTALAAGPQNAVVVPQPAALTDSKSGITLTAVQLVTPTDGQQFKFADQQLTLTVKNAATTGTSALTYSFQVASDPGFATMVYVKDGVAQGANGQTSLKIDLLPGPAAQNYFWRARAASGGFPGPFGAARGFSVGPQVVLQTPVTAFPAQNGTVSGTLTLAVNNVGKSGPVGPITYRFDLSDSASFSRLLFTQTVAEQSGPTTVTVSNNLSAGTYFWRVQADDKSNGVSSPISAVMTFQYQSFSMADATILDNPPDLASWGETAKITSIVFSPVAFEVDFDKRDGPNRWPDADFGTGSIEYTLGLCVNPSGHWYCSAVVQFWFGRELSASTPPSYVGRNWWYDARWAPIIGYQPSEGEPVGVFVAAGNLRDARYTGATCPRVCERSNVAIIPWPGDNNMTFTFSRGRIAAVRKR